MSKRTETFVEEDEGRAVERPIGSAFERVRTDAKAIHGARFKAQVSRNAKARGIAPAGLRQGSQNGQWTSSWIFVSFVSRTKIAPMTTVITATMIGYQSPW